MPNRNRYSKLKRLVMIAGLMGLFIVVGVVAASHFIINPFRKFILPSDTDKKFTIGLVLGAGVDGEGKPYDELKARLDAAADSLNSGSVEKLILSGDNRYVNYNEPAAMVNYLTEVRKIPAEKLQPDYAGRSTYESCERAAKIFMVDRLVIFSAASHLPRAIYLCRHFGIEAYGISSDVESNNSFRRELLARVKAVYNTHLVGERTILKEPIPL